MADDVGDAIESALAQHPPASEIVCVDDGSTDATLDEVRRWQKTAPRQVVVVTGPNQGAARAANQGLAHATAEWIQFLDADDLLLPGKVERQLALAASADADLVAGAFWYEGLDGGRALHGVERGSVWGDLADRHLGITSSMLWRADALRAVGGWSDDWPSSQEYEVAFRLLKNGSRVVYDHEPLTVVREREASISTANEVAGLSQSILLRGQISAYAREAGLASETCQEVDEALFRRLRMLYPSDPAEAVRLHDAWVPADFVPRVSPRNGRLYHLFYRLLGFAIAEQIRARLRR